MLNDFSSMVLLNTSAWTTGITILLFLSVIIFVGTRFAKGITNMNESHKNYNPKDDY